MPGKLEDFFTEFAFNFGAVAAYRFSEIGALELRLRDFVYTNYDRDRFSVSEPLLGAPDVPHPHPDKVYSDKKDTIHNIHFELGFSFTLGGR